MAEKPTPPNDAIINKYLNQLDSDDNKHYKDQEEALKFLFEKYPDNTKLSVVLIKSATLNTFYSTNIFKISAMAQNILKIKDFDLRIKNGDLDLIEEISKVTINEKKKRFYSFATKYCSFHQPNIYPIYDYYVIKMLFEFNREDKFLDFDGGFAKFDTEMRAYYKTFRNTIEQFKKKFALKADMKEIDTYLWLLGKEKYPRYPNKK